ncbi:MAG: SDR family oxidoreductase [Acidobacteriia bacterium]|nr:SDR family oxidoreductase [Terriglobia bacterium]
MSKHDREMVPIAVVGVSALFPGSADARGFWADILAGRDLVTDVPSTHWLVEDYYDPEPSALDKTYCKRGAFLSPVDFDPMEFGIPPSNMPSTDTSQILALIVAQKVLEDASQGQFASMDRERISVVLGVTSGQQLLNSMVSRLQRPIWIKALRESGIPEAEAQAICDRITKNYVPWHESTFPGLLGNVVAGRIANRFDLRGTNAVTDAACASSMAAVSMGINELQLGQADLVISGGVDTMNDIFMYMCFSKTPALSPTGDCRPFSDAADGTLLGEGLSMIALKRLADAERDGDRIYAVIRGIGSASDGRSKSVYAPLPEGQSRALRRTYESAGYGPETVELLEAHGTGTKAGDAAEFEGLRATFAESGRTDTQWCALGSVKSQIGHTKAAAGAAGLFKAIMALHHKVLPPTIKVERPNPALEFEKSAFYLNTQARPWIRDQAHPRRASVSSFGFGGSNFHVALEEYMPAGKKGQPAWRLRTVPTELVLLSAPDAADLIRKCREIAEKPGDLARTARKSQEHFCVTDECRLAIVAANAAELSDRLKQAADLITKSPNRAFVSPTGTSYATGKADHGGIAFLFPGQGSQYVGMGADVAMAFDEARTAWDAAAGFRFEGESIHRVVFPPPALTAEARMAQTSKLTATEWAQVALGVHSVALMNVLRAVGIRPECVAGHSFGEITALHAAGAFSETTLVKIARRRGELMRDASSTSGAMTAVTCSISEVHALLNGFGDTVVVANHNAPAQCVLSGDIKAIAQVEEALAGKGITARRLAVATAFHSPLVASSSAPFHEYLSQSDIAAPMMDVYGGASAAVYPRDARAVRESLAAQIAEPVRFLEQIEAMYARGVRTFIEVGAGSVLTELVGRILGDREHHAVSLDRKGSHGLTSLQVALGRLAVGGIPMDLSVLWASYAPFSDKPAKKAAMAIPVSGVNFGKPYPPAGGAKDLPPPNPPREASMAPVQADQPVATQRPVAEVATTPPDVQHAWVHAYQEAQRQTADAHAAYQRAMAESHMAFLKTAEASFAGLSALLVGENRTNAGSLPAQPVATSAPIQVAVTPPGAFTQASVEPARQTNVTPLTAPAPTSSPAVSPTAAAPAPGANLETLLLEVVSQKTGYPVEMLGAHMDMEADLGIDSIKRVEILSAMSECAPGLRDVKMTEFATLRTLGQIVEHMRSQIGGTANQDTNGNNAAPKEAAPPMMDLEALLLEVVSQKTGYPAEMLGAHMDLESDLGIDSIKRVEILSAMSERTPGLREVKMTEFATLRTLGQIAEHMHALRNGVPESKASANGFTPSNSAAPAISVHANGASSANGTARKEVSTTGIPAPGVRRFVVRQVATPAVGMALRGILTADCVWITDDGAGLAGLLAEEFSKRGVQARVVGEVPADANAVVFLGGLRPVASIDAAIAVNREAFQTARTVAARFSSSKSGVFVTVQDTGGDFGLGGHDCTRAWLGGVSALARTAALEWPHVSVKAIDCERGGRNLKAAVQAICTELFEGGATLEAGLRADGTRITLACVPETTNPAASLKLGTDSVIVASGGARGVTAAALIELAKAHHPRIVLLGRTPLAVVPAAGSSNDSKDRNGSPASLAEARIAMQAEANAQKAREIHATLDALTAAGSLVRYIEVDVQDGVAVSAALDSVRREWGPVTAIVHGAGVLADKRIADKTDEQFDRVFDTKVNGLWALLDATANDPLNAICLFSSVAARTGNPGQCDYAMANEVLNLVACAERARRGETCTVRSIGWGPWDGGMVTPGLKTHFKQMGVNVIPLDLGTKMFVDEMNSVSDDVTLVVGANGQGPLRANSSPTASVEVRVDAQSHPYLDDHRVAGIPVVPVVLALEWMVRAANACRPGLIPAAVRNLRVLNGIKLDRFERAGEVFAVNCRQSGGDEHAEITVELRGHSGTLHYSAVVEMAVRTPVPPQAPELPDLGPWTQSEIYDGHVLFHRERFQVIRSMDGISNAGIIGMLAGTNDVGWPSEAWCTDPALLDGGLQLAGLWTRQVLGGICLPMALADLRLYRPGLVTGPVRCVVHARQVFGARAVCDVSFVDPTGSLIVEMRGVETVLRPEEVLSASAAGASRA